jgi:hypothetical protein
MRWISECIRIQIIPEEGFWKNGEQHGETSIDLQ